MMVLSLIFSLCLVTAYHFGYVSMFILAVYAATSFVSFILYGVDKLAAINSKSRVPEAYLHLFALLGGWPGALMAQSLFKHKRRKVPFQITFWIVSLINAGMLAVWLRMQ